MDEPGPSVMPTSVANKQTKKRRGKSSSTHRKSGTRGGRPKKCSDSIFVSPDNTDNSPYFSSEVCSLDTVDSNISSMNLVSEAALIQEEPLASENAESTDSPNQSEPTVSESPILVYKDNHSTLENLNKKSCEENEASPINQRDQDEQEHAAYCPPDISVVAHVVEELRRRIFPPWVEVPEEEVINVLLLSRDRARTTQRSVFFSFNGNEEASVHCKNVTELTIKDILGKSESPGNTVLGETTKGDFVDRVVFTRFRVYEVCVRVNGSEYQSFWEIDKNGEIDKNPYHEARYSETFRPFECEILVPTQKYYKRRCPVCIKTKIRFRNKLPRHTEKEAPPTTANVHLDRGQLVAKVERQQKEIKSARAHIVKLKCELSKAITRDGVDIGDELSDDLCSVIDSAELDPVKDLFLREQVVLAKKNNLGGMRME